MKAFAMLKTDIEWRRELGINTFMDRSEHDVLGSTPERIHCYMPWKHIGFDKQGRPIVAKHMGRKCRIGEMLKHYPLDSLVNYHIWQQEACCKLLAAESRRLGACIEQWAFIIDAKGWHLGLATPSAMQFLRRIAAVDSDHYPERLGFCIVVNAPSALAYVWRIIRGWLTERQRSKICFCATREHAAEALLPHIDAHVLPEDYGGCGPALHFAD
eukprot:TRINITY_DN14429_c0_g1_i3.p1 TRINITY_DN14429_c0_g1~~TRINITY_DN14429_c0_g1_i3.p1  ORF type:complete len:214 (-),score=22.77 TRINITY_DN14429_c0_g1_i3:104-745(-)